jgi:hypothetical protein
MIREVWAAPLNEHCILTLPDDQRFVDATIEQYPKVARLRLGQTLSATPYPPSPAATSPKSPAEKYHPRSHAPESAATQPRAGLIRDLAERLQQEDPSLFPRTQAPMSSSTPPASGWACKTTSMSAAGSAKGAPSPDGCTTGWDRLWESSRISFMTELMSTRRASQTSALAYLKLKKLLAGQDGYRNQVAAAIPR